MDVSEVKRMVRELDRFSMSMMLFGEYKSDRCLSLLKSSLYSDLTLEVTDSHTEEVVMYNAHKCIMAVTSPIWEINLKYMEGNVLKFNGFPGDVIHWLINFAYTDKIRLESLNFCCEVMMAADFYCIPKLVDVCTEFVIYTFSNTLIDIEDFVTVLDLAALLEIHSLIELCIAYIEDNAYLLFFSEHFLQLSLKAVKCILSVEKYLLPEVLFVVGILRWSLKQTDTDNLRNFLMEHNVLRAFRFRLLSMKNIVHIFDSFASLFSDSEKYAIMKAIVVDEPFPFDFLDSNVFARGRSNINDNEKVLVLSPPLIICEEFVHIGNGISLPIVSLEIEPRFNTFYKMFKKRHEESVIIKLGSYEVRFDGVLDSRAGTVLTMPSQVQLELQHLSTFTIEITLNKPGVYMKNPTVHLDYNLTRSKAGIIRGIYNHDKQLNNILGVF